MSARYAILDGDTVFTVVEYDTPPVGAPPGFPDTFVALPVTACEPGWKYINGELVNPNPPPVISLPVSCSPAQFRIQLATLGKLDAAIAVAKAAGPEVEIAFDYATEFRDDSPKLLALAAQIGMSSDDVRNAIIAASKINIGAL